MSSRVIEPTMLLRWFRFEMADHISNAELQQFWLDPETGKVNGIP